MATILMKNRLPHILMIGIDHSQYQQVRELTFKENNLYLKMEEI